MKCLHIFRLLNPTSGFSCYRAIHTDGVMFARTRTRNVPRNIKYEPGLRRTEAALSENLDMLEIQNEEDLEDSAEFMNFDKENDMIEEEERRKERLGYIITAKRFFKDPPSPATLSCNERECIRYLHKTDPVQWNIKTLSEGFPATPDSIRKVLRGKFKLSEEQKRRIDLRVQKNWQLLSEGKLQGPPEVLEHLKKFINRREVLLDQIKKADFYLPEVKEEVTWNNGEMSNILVHYEKAIEKLAHKQQPQKQEMLSDGYQESFGKAKKISVPASSVNSEKLLSERNVEEKYNSPDSRTESLLKDLKEEYDSPVSGTEFAFSNELNKEKVFCDVGAKTEAEGSLLAMKKSEEKSGIEKLLLTDVKKKYNSPDSRTEFASPNVLKKLICEVSAKREAESAMQRSEEKSGIEGSRSKKDFSDPERLRREDEYYAKQVKDIENTAFWNKGRTNHDKALAEGQKVPLGGPDVFARGKMCSNDVYPERIKIPRNKRGSGLTFRVKDCYYDDDGEFLYRVPGMV